MMKIKLNDNTLEKVCGGDLAGSIKDRPRTEVARLIITLLLSAVAIGVKPIRVELK